jgi:ABC-2 type transport system ATP-binding protein
MDDAAIQFVDVVKDYCGGFAGRRVQRALHAISLTVRRGEVFGFLGPNGAGKTTALKILLSFIKPTAGEALLHGRSTQQPATRRLLGYLPETTTYPDYLTAREAVRFYARLSGLAHSAARQAAGDALRTVGLAADADRALKFFSKGMRQRVGLAQAIVHRPTCLVLDEPASGLDPLGRREMRELITQLRADGMTIFFSSHELSEVEAICDSIAILHRGRILKQGALATLLAEYTNYRTRADALEALFVHTIREYDTTDQCPADRA